MKINRKLFEEKFIPEPNSGCWLWTACLRSENGYGAFQTLGKTLSAHRVAYILYKGDIPKGMLVCHSCDVRSCVNPDHLFLGTTRDNALDKVTKGRCNSPSGEQHPNVRLSDKIIADMRALYESGVSQKHISEQYGICKSHAHRILKNKVRAVKENNN